MKHLQKLIISTTVASMAAFSLQAFAAEAVPPSKAVVEPAKTIKDTAAQAVTPGKEDVKKPVQATLIPSEDALADAGPKTGRISIVNRPLIAGLWGMNIPGAKCVEYYNFMENGEVAIKSAGEWTYGVYEYQLPETQDSGSPVLGMKIKYDNLQADCSGNAIDQSGEIQQHYVKWIGKSDIEFCGTEDGKECYVSLRKVLP